MRFFTAWSMDEKAAVLSWRYPALAEEDFPSGAINEALAAIYNHPTESLDHPYLFLARKASGHQVGLVITDPEGVALDQPDIDALFWATMVVGKKLCRNVEGDVYAVEWGYPSGQVFPVDPINAMLAALYNEGARPFVYPVYDFEHAADEFTTRPRQIGLIISPIRDLPGDASENWRALRDTYRTITNDEDTYPHDVPWGQKEWILE